MSATLSTAQLLKSIEPVADTLAAGAASDPTRRALLEAAAPLHLFSPSKLASRAGPCEQAAFIIEDIVPAVGWSAERLWTLKADVRRKTIAQIDGRSALADLRALNPDVPATDVQRMLDRWLGGEMLDPARMPATDVGALRTLVEWGFADFEAFPSRQAVDEAWQRRALVANFEQLAKGFVGRERELTVLRSFAGVAVPLLPHGRCLMLYGPGGAGKSALVSRFILELFDQVENVSVQFVYLALDDQTIDPSRPVTLMSAAVRQLEEQSGARGLSDNPFASFRKAQSEGERTRRDVKSRGSAAPSQRARLRKLGSTDIELNRRFAEGLDNLSRRTSPGAPFLFVIDTFEEASYRPESDLVLLYDMLQALLLDVPTIRLLLLGRAVPPGADYASLGAEELALGDLDRHDAMSLLADEGFDPDLAAEAIRSFGSNPLTLRLLAHAAGENALDAKRPSLAAAGEEVIRGYLYRRILNHIHDPVVRRLAHPGMVLRRITPRIIGEVLGPACGVRIDGPGEAERLFDALSCEHTLVGRSGDGALVYREEIRRPMLKLIEADAPKEVMELHRLAANFYAEDDDEISREEELYHLLMLPEKHNWRLTRTRFPSIVAARLASSIDEFPPASQVALAGLTRVRVDPSALGRAERTETDNILARDVLHLLRSDRFEEAAAALDRPIEPGSSLGPLKVRVLRELGRPDQAEAFARSQVDSFPALGSRARLAQLMWFAAQCSDGEDRSREWLQRLLPVARMLPRLALVQTLTDLKRVARPEQQGAIEDDLARVLSQLAPSDANREDRLLRLALVRLGPRDPGTWGVLAPDLLYGLNRSLRARPAQEVDALAPAIADVLRNSSDSIVDKMVEALDDGPQGRWLERLISLLDDMLRRRPPSLAAVGVSFLLFAAEKTSLSGASLAGLEAEEAEDWGPDAPSESAA